MSLIPLLMAMLVISGWLSLSATAAEAYDETEVKAAYLFRFTGYVEWPEQSRSSDPFTMAVLGSAPMASALRKVVAQQTIQGRPARVLQVNAASEARDAQILFVGEDFVGSVQGVTSQLASHPVLVVTDTPTGLDEGGIVNFISVNRRVRFEVSMTAARQAGLKLSSELLSVAARVRGAPLRSEASCPPPYSLPLGDIACVRLMASAMHRPLQNTMRDFM